MSFGSKEREVVLDVETTGFSPARGDRIIEIGVVELIDFEPTGNNFHHIVNPKDIDLSPRITRITGIREEDLVGKPKFEGLASDLRDFIGSSKVIAHNATFDRSFVNHELSLSDEQMIPEKQWKCTMKLARSKVVLNSYTLDALCNRFHISLESREPHHGALIDSLLTSEVYARLRGL